MMRLLPLPPLSEIEKVPPEEAAAEIARLAAIQSALAARLVVTSPRPAPSEPTKYVTAKALADALSLRVDRVYELARTGRIPCSRPGKRALRFDIEAVRKALGT
jgi:hypothetical protein